MHERPSRKEAVCAVQIDRSGRIPLDASHKLAVEMAHRLVGICHVADLEFGPVSGGGSVGDCTIAIERGKLSHVVGDQHERGILGHHDRTERIRSARTGLRQLERSFFNDKSIPRAICRISAVLYLRVEISLRVGEKFHGRPRPLNDHALSENGAPPLDVGWLVEDERRRRRCQLYAVKRIDERSISVCSDFDRYVFRNLHHVMRRRHRAVGVDVLRGRLPSAAAVRIPHVRRARQERERGQRSAYAEHSPHDTN